MFASANVSRPRIGICAFSCHQRWRLQKPVQALEFYQYGRQLGAEGVQASARGTDAKQLSELVERTGGYYEADVRLPKTANDLTEFRV